MFPEYLMPNPAFATPAAGRPVPVGEEVPEVLPSPTAENVAVELEAHGFLIVEIMRDDAGTWQVVLDSPYNRRITATTPIPIVGPAAGHDLLKTMPTAPARRSSVPSTIARAVSPPWGRSFPAKRTFISTSATGHCSMRTIPS